MCARNSTPTHDGMPQTRCRARFTWSPLTHLPIHLLSFCLAPFNQPHTHSHIPLPIYPAATFSIHFQPTHPSLWRQPHPLSGSEILLPPRIRMAWSSTGESIHGEVTGSWGIWSNHWWLHRAWLELSYWRIVWGTIYYAGLVLYFLLASWLTRGEQLCSNICSHHSVLSSFGPTVSCKTMSPKWRFLYLNCMCLVFCHGE